MNIPGFKKLDLYISKKFILSFFMSLLLIIGIVIIFDISEKIEYFVSNKAPLKAIIFDYYLNFIPYFVNMFSPLFVFITVIFFTSKMAANSEIVAILSCGISFHRMMVPYMAAAMLICILSLCLNLFVIPDANKTRVEFEGKYIKSGYIANTKNVHYQISPGEFVFVESFSTWNNTAYRFTLEKFDGNRLESKISAETAVWDSTFGGWKLKNYFIRDYYDDMTDRIRSGKQLDTVIALKIDDFYVRKKTVETLNYGELERYIARQQMRGDANVKYSLIEKHKRFTLPFSAFILTIMGVSLSSKKRRGGIGWNIGIGIALSFSYILFTTVTSTFAINGSLSPAMAAWIPNILYTFIAIYLYRKAPR